MYMYDVHVLTNNIIKISSSYQTITKCVFHWACVSMYAFEETVVIQQASDQKGTTSCISIMDDNVEMIQESHVCFNHSSNLLVHFCPRIY